MQVYEGHYSADDLKIALVVARFNQTITEKLLDGAINCLSKHGACAENLTVAWVPGSFELPLIAKRFAESGSYDAVIAIGCVIKGATDHYDYVCAQTASGILQASLQSNTPVIFCVLTTENIEQAMERSGIKGGNLGFNHALAAIEMAQLGKRLEADACV